MRRVMRDRQDFLSEVEIASKSTLKLQITAVKLYTFKSQTPKPHVSLYVPGLFPETFQPPAMYEDGRDYGQLVRHIYIYIYCYSHCCESVLAVSSLRDRTFKLMVEGLRIEGLGFTFYSLRPRLQGLSFRV